VLVVLALVALVRFVALSVTAACDMAGVVVVLVVVADVVQNRTE
jgi:hypothetical protein